MFANKMGIKPHYLTSSFLSATDERDMAPAELDQAVQLLKKHTAIGIALAEHPTLDAVAAFFALRKVFESQKKNTGKLFTGIMPEKIFSLIPFSLQQETGSFPLSDCIITVKTDTAPIKEIRYERTPTGVDIFVTPKEQPITEKNILIRNGRPRFDLVVTLGAPALAALGASFRQSPDLFYEKPTIAIAADPMHEPFAEVNLADAEKSSVSEIVGDLLFAYAPECVTKDIATALLAGMVDQTKNFQNNRTKPATLRCAEELIKKGADKNSITRVLWKTAPLSLIQLWGRASVRSRMDKDPAILWSVITGDDFLKTETVPDVGIPFVLERFEEHGVLPRHFALLWQDPKKREISAVLKTEASEAVLPHCMPYTKNNYWLVQKTFAGFPEAEEAIQKLLGISPVR